VVFGGSAPLVGIITDPPESAASRDLPTIILLNQGLVHRAGPNRLHVKIARRMASRGFVTLRFDFSGIGDSGISTDTLAFEKRCVKETSEAMDYLRDVRNSRRFLLLGICLGAVTGFDTAHEDSRVIGVGLINPQQYSQVLTSYVEARRWRYWKSVLFNPRRWVRPLIGRADYQSLWIRLRGLFVRKEKAESAARKVAADFRALVDRDIDMLLVYSSKDWGLEYMRMVFGDALPKLIASGKLHLEFVQQADHIFTPLPSQQYLFELIQGWAEGVTSRHSGVRQIG